MQQLVSLVNVSALVAIMLSMGLEVKPAAVVAAARSARGVALGLASNYVVVPTLTLGLLHLVRPDPLVAAGFRILAVCPGAPVGPPAATIARADVAWAVGLMVILGGLSAVLSPVLLGVRLPWVAPDSGLGSASRRRRAGDCAFLAQYASSPAVPPGRPGEQPRPGRQAGPTPAGSARPGGTGPPAQTDTQQNHKAARLVRLPRRTDRRFPVVSILSPSDAVACPGFC
jgi:hypothetical protein